MCILKKRCCFHQLSKSLYHSDRWWTLDGNKGKKHSNTYALKKGALIKLKSQTSTCALKENTIKKVVIKQIKPLNYSRTDFVLTRCPYLLIIQNRWWSMLFFLITIKKIQKHKYLTCIKNHLKSSKKKPLNNSRKAAVWQRALKELRTLKGFFKVRWVWD